MVLYNSTNSAIPPDKILVQCCWCGHSVLFPARDGYMPDGTLEVCPQCKRRVKVQSAYTRHLEFIRYITVPVMLKLSKEDEPNKKREIKLPRF